MAIDSMMKRMSAMNPTSPWRGLMLDATAWGFADGRAAADYMYSGIEAGPPPAGGEHQLAQICGVGRHMMRS